VPAPKGTHKLRFALLVNGQEYPLVTDPRMTLLDARHEEPIKSVEVILVLEMDAIIDPLGIKGFGEVANIGTSAAIANAVYHATGKRIRKLPIRIETLLD
jgi:hypothetical protein